MQRTFSTPSPVELYVELGSGQLRTTTSDTDETTVEIHGPRAEEFVVEQRDRQISVVAPRGKVGFFGSDQMRQCRSIVRVRHASVEPAPDSLRIDLQARRDVVFAESRSQHGLS